jgi:hypothetical protein
VSKLPLKQNVDLILDVEDMEGVVTGADPTTSTDAITDVDHMEAVVVVAEGAEEAAGGEIIGCNDRMSLNNE